MKRLWLPDEAAISAALWEEGKSFRHSLATDEQVTVARAVWAAPHFPRASDIVAAYTRFGLGKPPKGYPEAVIARLTRLAR